ncbi:MAG: histidinol-phosphate transaminase [Pseudomonadota bacterium]
MHQTLNRRALLAGLAGGAATLALPARLLAQTLGPEPGMIRLTSNENPYGPSPSALKAAAEASANGAFYPGRVAMELMQSIASKHGLTTDNVVLSSGSNEALCAAANGWAKRGAIIAPSLTYDLHLGFASRIGAEVVRVPLDEDFGINLSRLEAAVDNSVSMVYVCNPNNPTGMTLDGDALREFCLTVGERATVVVDEAYNELTEKPNYTSMVDLVREGRNVIVMRTFSKLFGMAGLRVGYAMGRTDLVARVRHHITSWPNVVGLAAAYVSYSDDEFIRFSRGKIIEGREIVIDALREQGIEPLPSQTNFVYADIGRDVNEFAARMRDRKVQIRRSYAPHTTHMRVSMGKLEELKVFADVFAELYAAGAKAA